MRNNRNFTTESPALAFAMRATRYTLARQIAKAHGADTYAVLDIVTDATTSRFYKGLTLTNGL